MAQFDNVSVKKKANIYFDGKCVSHTILLPNGTRSTIGVIFPSSLTFNTQAAEVMEITSEKLKETNTTCIMTTHSLDDAIKYGNKLIAMKNGVIIETFNEEEKRNLTKVDLLKLY